MTGKARIMQAEIRDNPILRSAADQAQPRRFAAPNAQNKLADARPHLNTSTIARGLSLPGASRTEACPGLNKEAPFES
jgi:hypothetical protein